MATYRGQGSDSFSIGSPPPAVSWTVVRGDTASFRVYVTDNNRDPLVIEEWDIDMDIKRNNSIIVSLNPAPTELDTDGEFTVSLTAVQSELLQTGDIFDIQLSDAERVWTIAKGSMVIVEDVTD